jgi:hypothetical protein
MPAHWFWWLLTAACVVWYSSVTVYVAIKGANDIKTMLRRLDAIKKQEQAEET